MSEEKAKISIGDYDIIMSDRNIFNQIVYTPLSEALRLLDERQKDPVLMAKVEELLKGNIPEVFKNNNKFAVLFRQIATLNYESKRFISIAKENNLIPVFLEYHHDKFTPENAFKYSLGKIVLCNGVGKHGGLKNEHCNIINFNESNGKRLIDIPTLFSESLVDFHKNLFNKFLPDNNLIFCEISDWIKNNGTMPSIYYINFLLLFVCNGILFENFLLPGSEGDFTKNVALPAIERIMNLTGVKPLIVPLEPVDMESDDYWYSYDSKILEINNKHHQHGKYH